jgi:Bacterial PH domain
VADESLNHSVYVVHPHLVRVITIIATVVLCAMAAAGWYLLPAEIRALFTVPQLLTLLGILAALVLGMVALGSSYVRADGTGLRYRNGLRVHAVPWARVRKIILRPGDPWAQLLMTPGEGRSVEADFDVEKRQLMGIQAVDGKLAKAAVNEIRQRHRRFLETS